MFTYIISFELHNILSISHLCVTFQISESMGNVSCLSLGYLTAPGRDIMNSVFWFLYSLYGQYYLQLYSPISTQKQIPWKSIQTLARIEWWILGYHKKKIKIHTDLLQSKIRTQTLIFLPLFSGYFNSSCFLHSLYIQ